MQERFALRFESGERRGEIIAIPSTGLTLGRRPGNSVQILDASVSGKHAEISIDGHGPVVRDAGSTNGTFVGSERVTEKRLAHRDLVTFGKVRMLVIDSQMDANPPAAPELELEGDVASAGEGLRTISADKLARSSKRSVVVGASLAVIALLAFAGWWFFGRGTSAGTKRVHPPVQELAGNLISSGYSFEGELIGWEADESANARFLADSNGAFSGDAGLHAVLASGERAIERSATVRATEGRTLRATAQLSNDGGAEVFVGIELTSSTGDLARLTAWSAAPKSGGGFSAAEVSAIVPPGYDQARALVFARATNSPGTALADDVGMTAPANSSDSAVKIGDYQWLSFGEPARIGVLAKIGRPLLGDVQLAPDVASDAPDAPNALGLDSAHQQIKAQEDGFALAFARSGASAKAHRLSLRVEPSSVAEGLATLGSGGYRTHQVEFQEDGVESVIVGSGLDLVRVAFAAPVKLSGRPDGAAFRIEAEIGDAAAITVQVAFQKERTAAAEAARRAREAEKSGKFGEALAAWKEMLDRDPFDAQLVKEAEGVRSRLIQQGLDEVQQAKIAAERARFFRLVDLYRQCRRGADAIAAKYAGSEVENSAKELGASIDQDLVGLEQELDLTERGRLESILAALEQNHMPKLAARVKDALAAMPGGAK